MKKLLKEVLEHQVAILDITTEIETDVVSVQGICEGFDLYIDINDKGDTICLYDTQDDDDEIELGTSLEQILTNLNSFTEYFNDMEEWYSDFMKYFKEITLSK
ncbi:hypothetical protein [Enterococcus mundtii]|uniref:hypothetical protein n=1 Tax=Enterococcus mundtii TaxID=53346 RepID=UPI001A95F59E|nr:hypothetical protein [Enterococcus mundtii]MBO1087135.1 hypothetical protein [Enterococcus mundtii]